MAISDTIPAVPVYTITIASSGAAMVDGVDVTAPGTDHQAARLAVLAEVRIKAAMYGRPVRATVKDVDGTSLPLIVDVDGTTTALAHPHPVPATDARAAAPADPRTLTVAAWQAVSDPENARTPETAELLTEAAEQLAAAGADRTETLRAIRNAHTVWHHSRDQDPETARELAPRLLDLLQDSHPRRTADVIAWVTSHT